MLHHTATPTGKLRAGKPSDLVVKVDPRSDVCFLVLDVRDTQRGERAAQVSFQRTEALMLMRLLAQALEWDTSSTASLRAAVDTAAR